jgi:chromosome segregation ATPase
VAERQRHFDRELSQTAADRDRLEERLTTAKAALDEAQRESQIAAIDIERLRRHEADLSAQVADLQKVRDDLGRQLIDASRTIERAGQREAQLVGESQHERGMRAALEQAVAEADVTLRETQQRHDAALASAAGELAEHRAQLDRELSRTAVECDNLRERLNEAESDLNQSRHEHNSAAAEVARLTQRETDLSAQLAHVEGARNTVAGKLSDALRETAEAREYAARERDAAEKRRADLELRIVQETGARETLERTLNETRSAALDAERWFREEADALRVQRLEREEYFDARLASERLEHENRLAEMQTEYERLGQARAAADKNVQRLSADLTEATRVLEDARREFQNTTDRLSTEHATALAALIAERDEQLKEQAVRHDVSLRASERARTELQERLHEAMATGRHEIEQVQEKLMATVEALDATLRRREILQAEVVRSSEPHGQREESRAKNLRSLEQAPLAALQCNEDSALV